MRSVSGKLSNKAATGVIGFDEMTAGGLPRGRTTLLAGGPGSGKTVFALQFLVHGAKRCKERGIFVAFEESSQRIIANAEGFGWELDQLSRKGIHMMDARPTLSELVPSGDFDLGGMLAVLDGQIRQTGATRIVFDALDLVLALLPDLAARRRELYRLHEWLVARGLTAVITAKAEDGETLSMSQEPFRSTLFMVDCAIVLNHATRRGVSIRSLRVQKYRGSAFDEDETPFVIGRGGFEIALASENGRPDASVTTERVSSGVPRLDGMLAGGYYRGASILITGSAGTGKTTLSGAFADAACRRGERTLFISFDSDVAEVVRNLASVAILLDRHLRSRRLVMISARALTGSADTYLERIKVVAAKHRARCVVIDPITTWSRVGDETIAHTFADRLIDWAKATGMTLVCTRLTHDTFSNIEAPLQISTLVDTWIHLNYQLQSGERNRALSVIKSRGTAHSNQVRELLLSSSGVTIADAYNGGGESLMGRPRMVRESAQRQTLADGRATETFEKITLDAEEAELKVRIKAMQRDLIAKRAARALLLRKKKPVAPPRAMGRRPSAEPSPRRKRGER